MRPLPMPTQEDLLSYFQPDYETGTLLRVKASGTQGKVGDGKQKQKRFNKSMPDALEQAIAYRDELVRDNYGEFSNIK